MRSINRAIIWVRASLLAREEGANLVEYAILLAFIVVVAIVGVQLVGEETTSNISSVESGFGP